MSTTAVLLVLALSTHEVPAAESVPWEHNLQTGSMLFSKGDCLAVKVFTASSYTHVAMVCQEGNNLYVYDASPESGVRRQALEAYLQCIAPDNIQAVHPARPLTEIEAQRLRQYLNSKLGTPYAVLHHTTGKRCEGVHCAELLTDALSEIDWLVAESPPRVSPGSLLEGITTKSIYLTGSTLEIPAPVPPPVVGRNRCEQLWIDTKVCCDRCCHKLSRLFLCR